MTLIRGLYVVGCLLSVALLGLWVESPLKAAVIVLVGGMTVFLRGAVIAEHLAEKFSDFGAASLRTVAQQKEQLDAALSELNAARLTAEAKHACGCKGGCSRSA